MKKWLCVMASLSLAGGLHARDMDPRALLEGPEAKAWRGVKLVERGETQEEGVALLREAMEEGSPVAMARLAALHYTGDAGFERNVELAIQMLQEAVDKGFKEGKGPLAEMRKSLPKPPPPPWQPKGGKFPGFGYPGKLTAYKTSKELKEKMGAFDFKAGWFVRDPIPKDVLAPDDCPDRLPYLLYSPAKSKEPVPMVIYIGGTGEEGTDLLRQFNHTVAFSKVGGPAFQKKHPCYLFAPMLPNDPFKYNYMPFAPEKPWPLLGIINDAMFGVMASLQDPPVDTNRLYLTGLSRGGYINHAMMSGYPGRFAAAITTSCRLESKLIPEKHPGNYWVFVNDGDYHRWFKDDLDEAREAIESRGGDFRLTVYPNNPHHDAWTRAWQEDDAWEWLFSNDLKNPPKPPRETRDEEKEPVTEPVFEW